MASILKKVLVILAMLAAIGYTYYNYTQGGVDLPFLSVVVIMLGLPTFNITRMLIEELRGK